MNWLTLSWWLTLAVVPQYEPGLVVQDSAVMTPINGAYRTEFGINAVLLDHVKLTSSMDARMIMFRPTVWRPFEASYRIGVSIFAKGIELGIRHECIHPVISWPQPIEGRFGSTTELFVTIGSNLE